MKNLTILSKAIKESRLRESSYDGELYNIDETIKELKLINVQQYLGSGKQRAFIRDYKKLYFSILKNTSKLNNTTNVTLRSRLEFLKDTNQNIRCSCGKRSMWDNTKFKFLEYCQKCKPAYPSKEYFKFTYGDEWKHKMMLDKNKRKETFKGYMTLDWFKEKYGEDGEYRYNKHYQKIFDARSNEPYSKISQELFWELSKLLDDECFFAEKNKEKHINLNSIDKKVYGDDKKVRINLDFVYKNKVIEFNGNYWHSKKESREIDLKRKYIIESKGFDLLFVWENDFKENRNAVLERCLRFLQSDAGIKFNSRYMIETKNGYENFDYVLNRGKRKILNFSTENTTISVSENHIFKVLENDIKASTLKIGDYLETKNGLEYIKSIDILDDEDVYDILHTDSHTYIANGVNNHNCEFLGSSHTLISAEKLKMMEPGEIEEIRDGKLKIYHYPEPKHQYIMTVDAAKDGTDNFAVQVVDITDFKFKQVAAAQLQIDYLLMPEFIAEWCEFYNNPYLIIENNEGAGQSIADQLRNDYEYENLHYDKDIGRNKKKKYPGFRTTTKTRKQILQTLKLFIENSNLEVNDASTISEFFQFILINNKYQADEGAHDDMIMSLALVFVPFCNAKNFEDMKLLVKQLYADHELQESEKVNFGDLLAIGEFQDYSDEEMYKPTETYFGGYMITEEFE